MKRTTTLNNGVEMPLVGYGVFQVNPVETERCVSDALSVGYRAIDTAQAYYNEEGVGNAWKKSGISRDDLFLTTKVWISNYEGKKAAESIDQSLRKLQTDYIDLLLLHQNFGDRYNAYRAMEEALKAGKVRAIGVSNFYFDRFIDIADHMDIKPAIDRKSTRLNSSHQIISYAVFCLKKKNKTEPQNTRCQQLWQPTNTAQCRGAR